MGILLFAPEEKFVNWPTGIYIQQNKTNYLFDKRF